MKKLIRYVVSAKEGQALGAGSVLQVFPDEEMGPVSPFIAVQHVVPEIDKKSREALEVVLSGCPGNASPGSLRKASWRSLPVVLKQKGVHLRLLTGGFENESSPLQTAPPLVCIAGKIEKGNRVQFSAAEGNNTLVYVLEGRINIHLESVGQHQLVLFEKEHDEIFVCAEADSTIFFLSVAPVTEVGEGKLSLRVVPGRECELQSFY